MTWKRHLLLMAAVCLVPAWALGADAQTPADTPDSQTAQEDSLLFPGRTGDYYESADWVTRGQSAGYGSAGIVRAGWWGVDTDGSLIKIGEWRGLESDDGFLDVDGLASDGFRTIDYSVSQIEADSSDVRVHYFGPYLTADVDLQRFIHRKSLKPLDAWFNTQDPGTNSHLVATNLLDTTDHAIRVQELDVKFSGNITENIKWGLDLWGMRKFGERQTIAMDHNCTEHQCHQVTHSQSIDWLTQQIEPYVEGTWGPLTVEYRRTMRTFDQDDGIVSRSYHGRPNELIAPDTVLPHAIVPENYTQIDRLKIGLDLTENTKFYSYLYDGDTHNSHRGTHRDFWGGDFRLINTTYDDLKLSLYGKHYEESNDFPPNYPENSLFSAGNKPRNDTDRAFPPYDDPNFAGPGQPHPVDRQRSQLGFDARYTPFQCGHPLEGLGFKGGYEYYELERQYVTYGTLGGVEFTQPDTFSHTVLAGLDYQVSPTLDTYFNYKMVNTIDPLYGFRESDENDPETINTDDTSRNTNQPLHIDRFEVGGTWTPSSNFLLSCMFAADLKGHNSGAATFNEDDYPVIVSAWYAPTCRLSLTGGVAYYSNWIDQLITFGNNHASTHGNEGQDTRWVDYGGEATVIDAGVRYDLTDSVQLVGEYQWVRGSNVWTIPNPPAGSGWETIPSFSNVIVEKNRFSVGGDWLMSDIWSAYVRYIYYDYEDETAAYNSGTAHMVLGGVSAAF